MPQCDSIGRPASRNAQAIPVSPTALTQCTPCLCGEFAYSVVSGGFYGDRGQRCGRTNKMTAKTTRVRGTPTFR